MSHIFVVGTADTKGDELAFLASNIRQAGGSPLVVDVGIRAPAITPDVDARQVAAAHPRGMDAVLGGDDRGTAVAGMAEAFTRFISGRTDIAGIIGVGGGGGTSIVTAGMQALPLGLPKLMVSTLASGDVSTFVGVSDVVMMPSITDLAGLNSLSRVILHNAAQAITAMANHPAPRGPSRRSPFRLHLSRPFIEEEATPTHPPEQSCVQRFQGSHGGRRDRRLPLPRPAPHLRNAAAAPDWEH